MEAYKNFSKAGVFIKAKVMATIMYNETATEFENPVFHYFTHRFDQSVGFAWKKITAHAG